MSRQVLVAWRALGAFIVLVAAFVLPAAAIAQQGVTADTASIENRAYLSFTASNGTRATDSARAMVVVARVAQLEATKTLVGADSVGTGDAITYRITVVNRSPSITAQSVIVSDTLAAGLVFVRADAPAGVATEVAGRIVRWRVSRLAPSESVEFVLVVRATRALVSANRVVAAAANAGAVVADAAPLRVAGARPATLTLGKSALLLEARLGDAVPYVLVIGNRGTTTLGTIVVRDVLPEGLRFVPASLTGADSAQVSGRDLRIYSAAPLAPGAERVVRYAAIVVSSGGNRSLVNLAVAESDRGLQISDSARATIRVRGGFALEGRMIVGKVYLDRNDDGRQTAGEEGVANAEIWSADGQRIITDREGRYSLRDVEPGVHAFRIDTLTAVPQGFGLKRIADEMVVVRTDGWTTPRVDFRLVPHAVAEPCPDSTRLGLAALASVVALPPTTAPLRPAAERLAIHENGAMLAGPGVWIASPADGAIVASNRLYVGLRGEPGATVTLYDGERQIAEQKLRGDGTGDFVGLEIAPGPHRLRARMQNSWKQVRWDSVALHRSGDARSIAFDSARATPLALRIDGDATVVRGRVLDEWSQPVATRPDVTVEARGAVVSGDDSDGGSLGQQRRAAADGWLSVPVTAGRTVGEGQLLLRVGTGAETTLPLRVLPTRRALLATGAGQIGVGAGPGSFGAVTARGAIGDETSLSLSFDSRRAGNPDFFGRGFDPLDESRYPTVGDGSQREVLSGATQRFAARLERGLDWLELGDVAAQPASEPNALLGGYQRSLTGVAARATTGAVTWRGFGSLTRQALEQVQLRGEGGSGPYVFGGATRPGTERVSIEVRAHDNAARVIARETLVRFTDYEIDYTTGAVLLRRPVPAADAYGNPVYVVAALERATGGDRHFVGGLRAETDVTRWIPEQLVDSLVVGVTGVRDGGAASATSAGGPSTTTGLFGADLRVRLHGLVLGAELLRGESPDSAGSASRASARWMLANDRASLGATWMRVDRPFGGGFDPRLASGLTQLHLDGAVKVADAARLRLSHDRQHFALYGIERQSTSVRAEETLGGRQVSQEIGIVSDRIGAAGTAAVSASAVTAKATVAVNSRLDVWVEGTHALDLKRDAAPPSGLPIASTEAAAADSAPLVAPAAPLTRPAQTGAGAAYRIFPGLKLEATHRIAWIPGAVDGAADTRYAVTSLDLRAQTLFGGEAWGGVERAGAARASHAALLGWNQRLALGGGWALSSLYERRVGLSRAPLVDPVRALPFAQVEADRWSAAGGIEWVPTSDRSRFSLRGETRDGEGRSGQRVTLAGDAPLGAGAALVTLHDWSRYSVGGGFGVADQRSLNQRSLVGLAMRPVTTDVLNVLAKVEARRTMNGLSGAAGISNVLGAAGDDRRLLGAMDAVWAVMPGTELAGRYAMRWAETDAFAGAGGGMLAVRSQFLGARAQQAFGRSARTTARLDGRMLLDRSTGSTMWSAAPSLAFRLDPRVEFEGGYRIGGLQDRDFASDGGTGLFATLGIRFTENVLDTPAAFWRERIANGR